MTSPISRRKAIGMGIASVGTLPFISCKSQSPATTGQQPLSTEELANHIEQMRLAGSQPNIVFIFTDDHAPHAISAYGSDINTTPHIDKLAKEGMIFNRSYCCNSICGPSRAAILTGLHSHANGFMRNGNRFDGHQQTFPQLLQSAGYQTALFGKWHLGTTPVGFDQWAVLPGQGSYYNPDFKTPEGDIRVEGYCTDLTTDMALNWLDNERDSDKPFVLMCQHKAPHRPWLPGPEELNLYDDIDIPEPETLFDDYAGRGPALAEHEMGIDEHMYMLYDLMVTFTDEEIAQMDNPDNAKHPDIERMNPNQRRRWDDAFEGENEAFRAQRDNMTHKELISWKYQRYIKNYLRCVAGVDRNVGRVMDYLDQHKDIADNTIVIYASDQGFYLGDHGMYDKRWMYEESFAMPLIARWPGHIPAGTECQELVQNIDYAPTFLALAGVQPDTPMHGTSLVPLLEGEAELEDRDALYYHYYESNAIHHVAAHYGVATDRYKLIHYYEPEHDYWELFDLQEDPDELTSVYGQAQYAEIQQQLHQRVAELQQEFNVELNT